jgi:predicted nucleotide-binding protein
MSAFHGKHDELKAKLVALGVDGQWSESNGNHLLRTAAGGILNWAPTKGTIWLQGPAHAKHALEQQIAGAFSGAASVPSAAGSSPGVGGEARDRATIFVVHGHDTEAREQLELALHRLGLDPLVLMNSSGGGDTIIEALEKRIGKKYTSDFGIVLFTPDDVGHAKDAADKADARARQNVVLEAGMLLASLTRARVVFLVKGHVEMPSDLHGVIYAHFNTHVKEALPKVIARMQEAGIVLDPAKIALATGAA